MDSKKKEKSSFGTGLFCAFAGIALGVAGKFVYDELTKDEREQSQTQEALQRKKAEKNENRKDNNNITTDYVDIESFLCPISQEIMRDPVITPKGISFERKAILDWLKKSQNCPITKTKLTEKDLITNYSLKNAIDEYIKRSK
jgi:hypothetical protein